MPYNPIPNPLPLMLTNLLYTLITTHNPDRHYAHYMRNIHTQLSVPVSKLYIRNTNTSQLGSHKFDIMHIMHIIHN